MKNYLSEDFFDSTNQFLRKMRTTCLMLFLFASSLFAIEGNSQVAKVNIDFKNAPIIQVIREIENQTDYLFVFDKNEIDLTRRVDIVTENKPVTDVLSGLFNNTNVTFAVEGTNIVLMTKSSEAVQQKSISGKVTDSSGAPLPGVSIVKKGTTEGIITDFEGKYKLANVPSGTTLVFSFVGMKSQEIVVKGQDVINIEMVEETIGIEEVVAVGYGTQKKATLTGAVASIRSEEFMTTKNQNVQNMLTGKLPGVRVVQKTSEPGNFNNLFDIRGFGSPLIIVDGVPRGTGEFQRMDPNDVESISILKDASAAIYGVRSANGVVLVTTKSGQQGKAQIEYSMYYGLQFPAEVLVPVGAFDRMTLMNEKYMRNQSDPVLKYLDEDFEKLSNGETRSYNWYDTVIRDAAPQQQHNLTVSGGNNKVDYFLNFGYMSQDGFFRSGDMTYNRYNIRSNVKVQVTDRLNLSLRLNGSVDKRDRPQLDAWETFAALWRTPTTSSIYANDNPAYYQEIPNTRNAVALTNADLTGYKIDQMKIFQSSIEASYQIPHIEGLSAKALFSFDNTMQDNTDFRKKFSLYNYSGSLTYDPQTYNKIHYLQRYNGNSESRTWNVSLNYNKVFNKDHSVNGVAVYEEVYTKGSGVRASRELNMPLPYLDLGTSVQYASGGAPDEYARRGLVGRLNYDYKSKYFLVGSFRYDGSSRFLPDNQWDLFYDIEASWRISEENFIKNNFKFISNLKLRGTYGRLGDDGTNMWEFLGGYDYGTNGGISGNYPKAYYLGNEFVPALSSRATPNYNIGWLNIYSTNIGLDADLWDGLFGFVFEIYKRDRDGIYATRSATLPRNIRSFYAPGKPEWRPHQRF